MIKATVRAKQIKARINELVKKSTRNEGKTIGHALFIIIIIESSFDLFETNPLNE